MDQAALVEALRDLGVSERDRIMAQARLLELAANPEAADDDLPVRTLREYLAADLPMPDPVVDPPLIVRGEFTPTVGKSGKGKTTLNLHRVLRWGAGLPPFDGLPEFLAPRAPVRSLIIENEGSAHMFQQKMKAMIGGQGFLTPEQAQLAIDNVHIWGDGGFSNFKIDSDKDFALLYRAVEKTRPDILFVEPFRGLWKGNENDATEMQSVVDRLLNIATDAQLAIILSHHERKSGVGEGGDWMDAGRGSSALDGAAAAYENFRPVRVGNTTYRELSYSKVRYWGAPDDPIRLQYDPETWSYVYVPENQDNAAVLDVFREADGEPLTIRDLQEATGDNSQGGYQRLRRVAEQLVEDKRLRRIKDNRGGSLAYRLVSGEDDDQGGLGV